MYLTIIHKSACIIVNPPSAPWRLGHRTCRGVHGLDLYLPVPLDAGSAAVLNTILWGFDASVRITCEYLKLERRPGGRYGTKSHKMSSRQKKIQQLQDGWAVTLSFQVISRTHTVVISVICQFSFGISDTLISNGRLWNYSRSLTFLTSCFSL